MAQVKHNAETFGAVASSARLPRAAPRKSRNRPRAIWFDEWTPVLDEALAELPECEMCPHPLFRLLAINPTGGKRRFALVLDNDVPIAVAALRRMSDGFWVPVTHYIVPGAALPAQAGRLMDAVGSLNIPLKLALWRTDFQPRSHRSIRRVHESPTYGMSVDEDFEAYWRMTGKLRDIRNSRKRCAGLSVEINRPGTARSIIEGWGQKWNVARDEVADRIVAAEYLESIDRQVSISLWDHGHLVGGVTCVIHDSVLVAQVNYRDSAYEKFNVGTYLTFLSFDALCTLELSAIDIGGVFGYKEHFAPINSIKHEVQVCGNFAGYHMHKAKHKLMNFARRN